MIDTHAHLDDKEYYDDIADIIARAKAAGVEKIFVPSVNLSSVRTVTVLCHRYPDYAYPMIGLHPEDVYSDYLTVLDEMEQFLKVEKYIAIGEVGLDFYHTREFEHQQLDAFERQIQWSIAYNLPLMLHVRKAQNEAVKILRRYERELVRGGVFHCFTGNAHEAEELLSFEGFALGIGGVLTFKNATLSETLKSAVPANRIVLETDAPYLAPVPMRGKRNESAYLPLILARLSEIYDMPEQELAALTTRTALSIFM